MAPAMAIPPDSSAPVPASLEIRRAPEPRLAGRVSANTLYLLDRCERQLYLACHAPELAAPPTDFDLLLMRKGQQHEREVREQFAGLVGPIFHGQPVEAAAAETRRLLYEGRAALYQPLLLSNDGRRVGVPDFLYWEGNAPVLHDAKLAVNLRDHGEIALQLTHYARLLEEMGTRPVRLEITNGNFEVVTVDECGSGDYRAAVERASALLAGGAEPRTLKTHSVCAECPFYDHCWPQAAAERRIEVLRDVTSNIVPLLRGIGVHTIEELAALTPDRIRMKGIASMAEGIVAEARAHRDRKAVWLADPELPPRPLVWFDLEGDPEGEEVDKAIYLWGLALDDGASEPKPEAIVAEFEDEGGRAAWERFVARAAEILESHPGARWVHYHNYEKTWLRDYARRYGAPPGFAERMEQALFDLYHKVVRRALRLPLYSYSIKQLAPWVGFDWRNPEAGSAWSIVQYQKAREARDPAERQHLLDEIVKYNEDDLWAMRAVWSWIEEHAPGRDR